MAERLVRQPQEVERLRAARALGVSPSVFHGRVLTELHQHFDAAGNPDGVTLVKREPEWTDEDRALILGLQAFERGVCECGFHESLTRDPSNIFRPGFRVCPVCAGFAQYGRMHGEEDRRFEDADKNRPAKAQRPSDGRHIHMSLKPDGAP